MVGAIKVYHLKPDRLATMIVLPTEQHFQFDPPHWRTRMSRHDPMKGELGRLQLDRWDSKLLHQSMIEQVDAAASIDEHALEPAGMRF
jgi:hypothetical protein